MAKQERYKPVEVDGFWFVMDLNHPSSLHECKDEEDARLRSRIWNLIVRSIHL